MKRITTMLSEIRNLSESLPSGKRHQVINRCNKISMIIKKQKTNDMDNTYTSRQIADRHIAKKAIFEAMTNGRKVSFLDSAEFGCSEFHTQICSIRSEIETKNLPWVLRDEWMDFGRHGKKCKSYWLESKQS